jgi:Mrp family chromosome partitioning ATPase
MASLDKAFIKAYRQQDPTVSAIPLDTSGTQSLVEALEDRPLREAKKQTAVARHHGVLAALSSERLQAPRSRVADDPPRKSTATSNKHDTELEVCNGDIPPFLRRSNDVRCQIEPSHTVADLAGVLHVERTARMDARKPDTVGGTQVVPSPHIDPRAVADHAAAEQAAKPSEAQGPAAEPDGEHSLPKGEDGCEVALLAKDGAEATGEPDASHGEVPEGEGFRPVLQVDCVGLSPVGERLQRQAADELDRLADVLMTVAGKGRKVMGFASDRRGQGTTTLLGCVALRLAERGERVAMADANIANPRLASELGLLPEYGWERGLADPMPLEEFVIESVRQSIALLPLCCPFDAASLPGDFSAFQAAITTLREHYGMVLVDLGVPGDALIGSMASVLDTVLLVRDVRNTQLDRISDLHRMFSRAGVNVAGMIESFVRGG